jgi:hypothetical protein
MMLKILGALWDLNKAPLNTEEEKTAFVWAAYLFPFSLILVSVWITHELAEFFNLYLPLGNTTIKYLQIGSVAVFAVGSLGNQYNRVVSWSRNTPAELLNAKISRLIICIGIFLTFFAYHLVPSP